MNKTGMESMCWLQKLSNRLSLVFLLCYSVVSFAQDGISEFKFKKVGKVVIQSDGEVDQEFLLGLIEITPQVDILTASKVRRSIELLYATGEFTNIFVDATAAGNAVDLTFILRTVYRINDIDLEGDTGVPARKIRRRIQLRKLEPFAPEKVLKARQDILKVLHENGFYEASVQQDVLLNRKSKTAELNYVIQAGRPALIGSIVFTGNLHFPQASLFESIELEAGERFRDGQFNRALEKLKSVYDKAGFLEHQIEVTRKERTAQNRMNIEINIDAGKRLVLQAKGYDLSQELLREKVPIWTEHSYNDDTLEEGERSLAAYLQTEGFYDAEVSWKKEIAQDQILIEYLIQPGLKYEVEKINFKGNTQIPSDELLEIMQTKETGILGASRLIEQRFEADQDRILGAYRLKGYLFARLRKKDILRFPTGKIHLNLEIEEGPQSVVSEIRIEGNVSVKTESLLEAFQQKAQEPVSEAKVKADSTYVVALYSDLGYPKVEMDTKLLFSQDKTRVILGYKIKEGEQVFVDRIVTSGNYRTKRHIIEEAVYFGEDEPLSLRKISQSQSRLYATNIFDRVDIQIPRPDNLQKFQNVYIRLSEAKPYTLSYGFGYQTFDKLRGLFAISNRNLWGTGRTLAFQARGGFKQALALITYVDPHLFFHKVNSTITGFYDKGDRRSFSYTRYGATLNAERKLSRETATLRYGEKPEPAQSLFFRYDFEDNDASEEVALRPEDRPFLTIHLSAVSGSYVRDARDNDIDPLSGTYVSTDLQVATHYIGSDPDFVKSLSHAQYYYRVGKSVAATSLRLGLARAFEPGTDQLPLSQRFFAGGGRTIRGFELDTAGPTDDDGNPEGGNMLVILNLEYRFPIFGNLGGIVFFDYGNVFSLVSDFSFPDLRKTSGIGIRYKTPIGPLTLDWGYKLDRQAGESPSEFFFSVGHAF